MIKVKCDVCNSSIDNWNGNVMVLKESIDTDTGVIDDLQIWCKPCTKKLDNEGTGRAYHNLWELSWVKEDGEDILNTSGYVERFSNEVRNKLIKIIKHR